MFSEFGSSSSSSSSSRSGRTVDVSLNSRGERNTCAEHLCHALFQAICAFRDDEELCFNRPVIGESRISAVVFSKGYASSRWCFDELQEIFECKQWNKDQIGLPIFYHIDPSDVRKQRRSFKEAFDGHEERFKEKVNKFREALMEAARLSEWMANGYRRTYSVYGGGRSDAKREEKLGGIWVFEMREPERYRRPYSEYGGRRSDAKTEKRQGICVFEMREPERFSASSLICPSMETMELCFGASHEPADEDKNEAPVGNINAAETDQGGAHYRTATELSSGLPFVDDRHSLLWPATGFLIGWHPAVLVSAAVLAELTFTFTVSLKISAAHVDSRTSLSPVDQISYPGNCPFRGSGQMHFPSFLFGDASSTVQGSIPTQQDEVMNSLLTLCNSVAFFTSVALIVLLTHKLSIKLWLLASMFSITGAYMCSVMASSPGQFITVLVIGSAFWFVTVLKCEYAARSLEIFISSRKQKYQPKLWPTGTRYEGLTSQHQAALIAATLLATTTFTASLRLLAGLEESSIVFKVEEQDAVINNLFVLFNSIAFFMSLALIMILTRELPIKPWLLVLLSSAVGGYMCSIKAVSPHQIRTVLFVGSSILSAASFKCLDLQNKLLNYLGWVKN